MRLDCGLFSEEFSPSKHKYSQCEVQCFSVQTLSTNHTLHPFGRLFALFGWKLHFCLNLLISDVSNEIGLT